MKFQLILTFLVTISLSAVASSFDSILNSQQRLSVKELIQRKKELELLPRQNTLTYKDSYLPNHGNRQLHFDYNYWLKSLEQGGPKFIATIEKSFPGATWAFIGRDSMALSDMVEAFYLSIGQENRVTRIGMSKETFATSSAEDIEKYLVQIGPDLDTLPKEHPFILIDTVSSGYGRQGRAIIESVYSRYVRNGGNPANLVDKFNMIGVVVSTFKGTLSPVEKKDKIVENTVKYYLLNQKATDYAQQPILTYNDQTDLFGEAGYEHYTGAWHQSYKAFKVGSDGHIQSQPGELYPEKYRLAVLQFQLSIIDSVMTEHFRERVQKEAINMGYTFPMMRPRPQEKKYGDFDIQLAKFEEEKEAAKLIDTKYQIGESTNIRKEVQEFFKKLEAESSNKKQSFLAKILNKKEQSSFDKAISFFMKHGSSVNYSYEFIRELELSMSKNLFTPEEMVNLLAISLEKGVLSKKFVNKVMEIISADSIIKDAFKKNFSDLSFQNAISLAEKINSYIRKSKYFSVNKCILQYESSFIPKAISL